MRSREEVYESYIRRCDQFSIPEEDRAYFFHIVWENCVEAYLDECRKIREAAWEILPQYGYSDERIKQILDFVTGPDDTETTMEQEASEDSGTDLISRVMADFQKNPPEPPKSIAEILGLGENVVRPDE